MCHNMDSLVYVVYASKVSTEVSAVQPFRSLPQHTLRNAKERGSRAAFATARPSGQPKSHDGAPHSRSRRALQTKWPRHAQEPRRLLSLGGLGPAAGPPPAVGGGRRPQLRCPPIPWGKPPRRWFLPRRKGGVSLGPLPPRPAARPGLGRPCGVGRRRRGNRALGPDAPV